jgi:hypothetical protein
MIVLTASAFTFTCVEYTLTTKLRDVVWRVCVGGSQWGQGAGLSLGSAPPRACFSATTHSSRGTSMRNFFESVKATPLSICSHTVRSMCSPWSSHTGEPRFQCSA